MDELLSNLDARLRDGMRRQLISLHRHPGKAAICVTDGQLQAMRMVSGRVRQSGTPEEAFQRPANLFVAEFIGHPRMNLPEATSAGGNAIRIGDTAVKTEVDAGPEVNPAALGVLNADGDIDNAAKNAVTGQVVQSEFTGADAIKTLEIGGGQQPRLRKHGHRKSVAGSEAAVSFRSENIHLFDRKGTPA
ncbi:MAG: TOBE domain-containing protein [Roseovarius sp.]|nr:TOBE domain-containing protein [Roseovarius sp.]